MVSPVNTQIENYDPENYLQRDIGRGIKVLVDQNTHAQIAYSEVRPWHRRSWRLYFLAPAAGLGALALGIFGGKSVSSGSSPKTGGACLVGATGLVVSSVYLSNRKYPVDRAARIMAGRAEVLGQRNTDEKKTAVTVRDKISNFFTPKERSSWIAQVSSVEDFGTNSVFDLARAVKDGVICEEAYERLNSLHDSYKGALAKELIESTEYEKLKAALEEFKNECDIQVATAEKEYNANALVHEASRVIKERQAEVIQQVNAINDEAKEKQAEIESESSQTLERLRKGSRGELLEVVSLQASAKEEYYDAKDKGCRRVEELLSEVDLRTKAIIHEYNESVQPLMIQVKVLEEKYDSLVGEAERELTTRFGAFSERTAQREEERRAFIDHIKELNQRLSAELSVSDSAAKSFVPHNFSVHSSIRNPELREWAMNEMKSYVDKKVDEEDIEEVE